MQHDNFLEELIFKFTEPGRTYTHSAAPNSDPREEEAEAVARWLIPVLFQHLAAYTISQGIETTQHCATVDRVNAYWKAHHREDVMFHVSHGPEYIQVVVLPMANGDFVLSMWDARTNSLVMPRVVGTWGELDTHGRRRINSTIYESVPTLNRSIRRARW